MAVFNATIYRAATVISKTTCIPFTLVVVEEEDNKYSAITAIQVSSKTTCIPFTLGV